MRDSRIDNARLLGNLAICATHAYPFMYAVGHDAEFWFWSFFSMNFCIMSMPAFFLISGYLLFLSYDSITAYAHKMASRVKRLLIPIILWNIIACVAIVAIGLVNPRAIDRLRSLRLDCAMGWIMQVVPVGRMANLPLWYMRAAFVFSILSPLAYLIYKKIHWLMILISCLLCGLLLPNLTSSDYPMYGICLFYLGGLAAVKHYDMIGFIKRNNGLMLTFAFFVLTASCVCNFRRNSIMEPLGVFKFLCAPLFLSLALLLERFIDMKFVRTVIAPASFFVYVGHSILTSIFMHSLGAVLPNGHGKMTCIAIMTLLLSMSVCVVGWHLMNRFFPRVTKILDGRM